MEKVLLDLGASVNLLPCIDNRERRLVVRARAFALLSTIQIHC